MRPSPAATELSGPRRPADETASQPCVEAPDRLSALPDDLLHRIISSLKAWEVVRTCVLARRWRHLWASAACLDLRTRHPDPNRAPENLRGFIDGLFLSRDASAPLDTLRLRSSEMMGAFSDDDSADCITLALNRGARVVHAVGHRRYPALFKGVSFVSCHLKVLKLSYATLDDRILGQISSGCTSLEELDIKDCLVTGDEIASASLKTLIILKCRIGMGFSVAAPNLVQLRLVTPYGRVPLFENLGSLVTATIIVDDYFLSDDVSEDDNYEDTTDDDSNCGSEHTTDQEDCNETSTDGGDDNCLEHSICQEDCVETTDDHGSEHIADEDDCDDDDDDSNCGSENIIDQEGRDETASSYDDGDDSNCGTDQGDCDETTDNDDDGCNYGSEHIIGQDDTTDDEGHDSKDTEKRENYKIDDDLGYISEDDDFDENSDEEDGSDNSETYKIGYGCGGQKGNYGHDSDIDSDVNTYEYSEIAKEIYDYRADNQNPRKEANYHRYEINDSGCLGGQNILRSISNVTSLGLLTDAGEVVMSRELKRCPTFSNLKTLSLGEWCMTADFDAVIFLLQHSPNLERLFLQLKLNFDTRSRKALQTGIKLQGRSFTCKDLQMVKIKCSKDDERVHNLANLFIANGIPLEKILVRRSGSAYLRAQEQTDQAMHELMVCGPEWTNTKVIRFLERSSLVAKIRL